MSISPVWLCSTRDSQTRQANRNFLEATRTFFLIVIVVGLLLKQNHALPNGHLSLKDLFLTTGFMGSITCRIIRCIRFPKES